MIRLVRGGIGPRSRRSGKFMDRPRRAAALLGMKLAPLLALSLAGCSLYFGDAADDPSSLDPGAGPDPDPAPESPASGTLPARCGSPEVHVIGVYETRSDHSGGDHPTGEARVTIERPGDHVLVLSAYEPTSWRVTLAPRAHVQAITLIGYYEQTVDLPNVPVAHDTGCGYSYPYNGQGCDTNALLALAQVHAGTAVTSFHGCYQASDWTLHADGTVASSCNTSAGYEVDQMFGNCGGGRGWMKQSFATYSPASCTGARYVRRDDRYGAWVGAILCGGANSYKLYMSATLEEPFLEIADYAGHGRDHCELVNPAFTLPNEDDITSGGCTSCSVGELVDLIGVPVYARARFGEPFQRVTSQFWADLTTTVYSCGVSIP
jgi:hypothetical protein